MADVDPATEQIAYYEARAQEYDATAYAAGGPGEIDARIARALDSASPTGRALELACGTGRWSQPLAARVSSLLAVDAAGAALAIARTRAFPLANVSFERADVWSWQPVDLGGGFDTIVMSFWLSHVPRPRWPAFFDRVSRWLAPGGRVVVVDEHPMNSAKERWLEAMDDGVAVRTLRTGEEFRIVKVYVDPADLSACLGDLGLAASVRTDEDWVICVAHRPA